MDGQMRCPRCGEPLSEKDFKGVAILGCHGCKGILVEQPRLLPLVEKVAEELAERVYYEAEIEPVEDPGPVERCPACGAAMENTGYMGSKEVLIDRCDACWRIWIDPQELGNMGLMLARSEQRAGMVARRLAEARERVSVEPRMALTYNRLSRASLLEMLAYYI
ncbi:MAG: zf-TFIIB domain-containing protein [Deltaproteobacteria bacterium]|nr:zf-TFIIB domain-containing protein [Deltaproteobacteria bacterium]